VPASRDAEGRVILSPESARTSGGAKLDDSRKYLTGWTAAGAMARWLLPPGLPEGGYDVEVSFSLTPAPAAASAPGGTAADKGAGTFEIRENFHTLTRSLSLSPTPPPVAAAAPDPAPAPAPKDNAASTGGSGQAPPADGSVTVVLGTLRLCTNAVQLEFRAVTPEPGALLQLRSLRLIPVASSSS
jgi:hypothetical protein